MQDSKINVPACKRLTNLLLPCPCCGTLDASISINLGNLGDEDGAGEEFTCGSCETSFGRALLAELLAKWPAVIAWVESVPQFEE